MDDLFIFLSDPVACKSKLLKILVDFGCFSGYKMIDSKSVCFPINDKVKQVPDTDLPFCVSHSGFKYLGINITPFLF